MIDERTLTYLAVAALAAMLVILSRRVSLLEATNDELRGRLRTL